MHRKVNSSLASIAIDAQNGIFMVAKTSNGLISPVHVQKSLRLQKFKCSNPACADMMKAAEQHFSGTECKHLESVKYAEIPSFCNL